MKQLLLALSSPPALTLENFAPGSNAELLSALRAWLDRRSTEPSLLFWGAPGSGKTHLLCAAVAAAAQRGERIEHVQGEASGIARLPAADALAIDDIERLSDVAQTALFRWLVARGASAARLLLASGVAPAALTLRADLRSRLLAGLVYQLHLLSDEQKTQALRQHAAERGLQVPEEALEYLQRRAPRDLPSLMAVLDALDRYSLQSKRPITLPLVREVLLAEESA